MPNLGRGAGAAGGWAGGAGLEHGCCRYMRVMGGAGGLVGGVGRRGGDGRDPTWPDVTRRDARDQGIVLVRLTKGVRRAMPFANSALYKRGSCSTSVSSSTWDSIIVSMCIVSSKNESSSSNRALHSHRQSTPLRLLRLRRRIMCQGSIKRQTLHEHI